MRWVTREHPKTDRIACPWLIRKFIDPDAEIVYVPRDEVLPYAEREGATSFDADATPQSPGLLAIADGFALLDVDDQRQLELELPVYDALYAWARHQVANA